MEALLKRWDATAHVAMAPGGELLGYSINTTEQRGKKCYVYDLHVAESAQGKGIGRALLELVEGSGSSRGRAPPVIELQCHTANEKALGFYKHVGFVESGSVSGGNALVLRRAR